MDTNGDGKADLGEVKAYMTTHSYDEEFRKLEKLTPEMVETRVNKTSKLNQCNRLQSKAMRFVLW